MFMADALWVVAMVHSMNRERKMNRMSDDTISRQAAIEALERIFDRCEEIEAHLPDGDPDKTGYKMFPDYITVWKYLRQLPSAERRGRWEMKEDPYGFFDTIPVCSACGCTTKYRVKSAYCPNCGARMEAVTDRR